MATDRKKTPDFFGEDGLDPVETATGSPQGLRGDKPATPSGESANTGPAVELAVKKKAGFYLSVNLLNIMCICVSLLLYLYV